MSEINQRNRLKTKGDHQGKRLPPKRKQRGDWSKSGSRKSERAGRKWLPAPPINVHWLRATVAHFTSSVVEPGQRVGGRGNPDMMSFVGHSYWANWRVAHAEENYILLAWSTESISKHQTKQKLGGMQQNTLKNHGPRTNKCSPLVSESPMTQAALNSLCPGECPWTPDPNAHISSMLGLQAIFPHPAYAAFGDWTQGFIQRRQALYNGVICPAHRLNLQCTQNFRQPM